MRDERSAAGVLDVVCEFAINSSLTLNNGLRYFN